MSWEWTARATFTGLLRQGYGGRGATVDRLEARVANALFEIGERPDPVFRFHRCGAGEMAAGGSGMTILSALSAAEFGGTGWSPLMNL